MQKFDTIIVGGGIAGLSAAYWLKQENQNVLLLEKNHEVGGCIQSFKENGFLVEKGPASALETSEPIKQLISDLDLKSEQIYASNSSKNKFIVKNLNVEALPSSPIKFITTPIFSPLGKLRFLLEPFIKKGPKTIAGEDETLADFTRRRVGQNFLDYAINPMVAGVFSGDPHKLSVRSAFPKLYNLEAKYGGLVKGAIAGFRERRKTKSVGKNRAKQFSFINGMSTITHKLSEFLSDQIKCKCEIVDFNKDSDGYVVKYLDSFNSQTIEVRTDNLILAIPTYAQAKLFESKSSLLSQKMQQIHYPAVATITTAFHKKDAAQIPDGYGYLVPEKEKCHTLGTIWSSSVFENRSPKDYVLYMSMVGGVRAEQRLNNISDEKLLDDVLEDLNNISGIAVKPVYHHIKRWAQAIPQYDVGYQDFQKILNEMELKFPGLYFAGNYRNGIGTADSVKSSWDVVLKIKK